MSKIKILIVEDEFIIAENLSATLETLGYEIMGVAGSYGEAMELLDTETPDLALLDINLGGNKDGIDLAWKIKENYNLPFIFLTANADTQTVDRAKLLDPPAYLLKPFSREDLYVSIELCLFNYTQKQEARTRIEDNYTIKDALFVKSGNSFTKIKFADILYLESDHVYVIVHTADKKLMVRTSMQEYLDHFPPDMFFRIHRTYIVNINHLESFDIKEVRVGGVVLPLAKNYREELIARLHIG